MPPPLRPRCSHWMTSKDEPDIFTQQRQSWFFSGNQHRLTSASTAQSLGLHYLEHLTFQD
jgi:hypothetical protein